MSDREPGSGEESTLAFIAETVRRIEEMLKFLPVPAGTVNDLKAKLSLLRTTILEQRPPAFALVGRRGSGKSSLINALASAKLAELGHVRAQTGRGRWIDHQTARGALSILDTRGVQEGSSPAEGDTSEDAIASILVALETKPPDIVVFLVKATEVDSAIDADLDALERVYAAVERKHHLRPPLVLLATHCDLLEPKATRLHREHEESRSEVDEKLSRVAEVEHILSEKVRGRGRLAPHLVWTRGVSTYLSFRDDGTIRGDERWRIEELIETLFRHLPDAGRGMFVRVARLRAAQESLASDLTNATAALCAGIAAIPIPIADVIPITTLQLTLVTAIAWLSGRDLDRRAASEFIGALGVNVGAAFAFREGARALVKFVFPGAGSMVSGAVAFAGTMAIGTAARHVFLRDGAMADAKRVYDEARKNAGDP
jgi:uncharacterized protein (DUF697 family)/GTP-binding protein EngB required for normal cell division